MSFLFRRVRLRISSFGLTQRFAKAWISPAVKEGLAKQGFEPAGSTPAELRRLVESDISRWGAIVKQTGFKPID